MSKNLKSEKLIIAIVAGEHSGDAYGAMIMQNLKQQYPNGEFIGVGGEKMLAQGLKSLMPMDILSVIGIVNVLKNIVSIYKAKNKLVQEIISYKPDCFIGVDAPDFNLVVAKNLKKASLKNNLKIKTIQYISPTIWAWRAKRIYTVAKATDTVLCIFPFEKTIYQNKNISAKYVGHPLADKLKSRTDSDKQRSLDKIKNYLAKKNISKNCLDNKTIISLFPGSRTGELEALSQVFIETAIKLYQYNKNFSFLVPIVSPKLYDIWQKYYAEYIGQNPGLPIYIIKTYDNDIKAIDLIEPKELKGPIESVDLMRASDLILCASGTTTLEAFLLNIPMVVAYKVSKINYWLISLLIKVRFVAMPNIIADKFFGKNLVPEFLQDDVTVDNLSSAILKELNIKQSNQNWNKIQNYLREDNLNHEVAVTNAIVEVLKG